MRPMPISAARPLSSAFRPALLVWALAGAAQLAGCEAQVSPVCGDGATTGNNEVPSSFPVEMGAREGAFTFHYETRDAKDRVLVVYEGKQLFDSGCVGETRDVELRFGPGQSSEIDVVMQPNCGGTAMTSWLFRVGCPSTVIRDGGDGPPVVTVTQTGEPASPEPSGPPRRQ